MVAGTPRTAAFCPASRVLVLRQALLHVATTLRLPWVHGGWFGAIY